MIVHHLNGCAPAPLAHYLKALGILRLVSEQLEPGVRGWWDGERFLLASEKTEEELLEFFCERYEPTPLVNPWGARSGFYPGSSEKTSREVLERIAASSSQRFARFREVIAVTKSVIAATTGGGKPSDGTKLELVRALRTQLRGSPLLWLEAVLAVTSGDGRGIEQPAIFGTGGSEGSGSYTAAFMKAVRACLIDRAWDSSLFVSLFAKGATPRSCWGESFGQFAPAGCASPWDLILAFEGACLVRSSVVRRSERDANRWMASPFFVAPVANAFPSSSRIDEFVLNKGTELPGRGEQWFPLWAAPATCQEISSLFAQGRATCHRGRRDASDGCAMSQAIARVGVARGITKFLRYGYLQRNNQATHFAVPLGRFVVPERRAPDLICLDDLEAWLPRLRREAREKSGVGRLRQVERRLGDALFAVTQHPDEPLRWQTLLLGLAGVEAIQVTGSGHMAGPIPKLRPGWVRAADDGSVEFRLAVSFALQAGRFDRDWIPRRSTTVRRHWLTLERGRYVTTGAGAQQRLQSGVDRVLQGRSGIDDAVMLVSRRLVEASAHGSGELPLRAARSAAAAPSDLARLVAGEVDLDRTVDLARALMALDAYAWAKSPCAPRPASSPEDPDDAWIAIRLATWRSELPHGARVGTDPAIVRRLDTGDAATAVALALRKLREAGVIPTVRSGSVSPRMARLWAAALAFPITRATATRFLSRLDPRVHPSQEATA